MRGYDSSPTLAFPYNSTSKFNIKNKKREQKALDDEGSEKNKIWILGIFWVSGNGGELFPLHITLPAILYNIIV